MSVSTHALSPPYIFFIVSLHGLIILAPQLGQISSEHGTPRLWGMVVPQFGHLHSPPGPSPRPPGILPRPPAISVPPPALIWVGVVVWHWHTVTSPPLGKPWVQPVSAEDLSTTPHAPYSRSSSHSDHLSPFFFFFTSSSSFSSRSTRSNSSFISAISAPD